MNKQWSTSLLFLIIEIQIWPLFQFIRIDAFKLWCWRRLLRVPWTARRSNQSILKEINPEYSLEGLMPKLRLQHWPPDAKNWLIGKDPDAGKDWGQEKRATEDEMVGRHHPLNGHEFEQTSGDSKGQGSLVCCSPWCCRVGHDWATQQQQQPTIMGFPCGTSGKEPNCLKRHGFNPRVGKILCRRAPQPTPVFLPRESHGQRTLAGQSIGS